jgi:peptide/nickel transport system ATP-binding protein
MSVIFVTHDIGVANEICVRVAVLYAGQIVGTGTTSQIVKTPVHPYAQGLLASTIHGAERGARLETIPGTPPSLDNAPVNCSFAPRCSFTQSSCLEAIPANVDIGRGRRARCILAQESV